MAMFDTHTHLNDPRFAADRTEVLARARAAGVQGLIVVGYDLPSSRVAVELATQEPGLWAAVGVHPHGAQDVTPAVLEAIRELAQHKRVVAIGETGLDYYRNLSPSSAQQEAFRQFIQLAGELERPLIVHCREAQEDCLRLLDATRKPSQAIIMHCFAGGEEFATACLQRGFYLGIAGTITYPKAFALRRVAAEAPLEQLLVETDCPWLPPQGHRGQRNEPAFVREVVAAVAAARGLDMQEVALATMKNAWAVFSSGGKDVSPAAGGNK